MSISFGSINTGLPKDIVKHLSTGYRAKQRDAQDLAKGIEWIVDNNKNNKLGIAAKKRAISLFDLKVIVQNYVRIYEKLIY